MNLLRDLWRHRLLVAGLVRRDFQVRSVRAVWGNLWLVIQPAIQILIYTVIFAEVLRARLPGSNDQMGYALYVCVGLITWNYFSDIVMRSQTLFAQHADLLKTIRFPRSALPVALVISASIQFAIVCGLFSLMLIVVGRWPGIILVEALPLLVCQVLLAVGLGLLTGTINVFFRDVGEAVAVFLQFGFWLTPIVYPLAIVPEALRSVLVWNPMLHIIGGYQGLLLEGTAPNWQVVGLIAILSGALCVAAWGVFRALSPDLVDEL